MLSYKATLLLLPVIAICQGCSQTKVSAAAPAPAPNQINFLSIVVDQDTAQADTRLKRFLEKAVAEGPAAGAGRRTVKFQQQTMPYGDVIRSFAEADPRRGYLARI